MLTCAPHSLQGFSAIFLPNSNTTGVLRPQLACAVTILRSRRNQLCARKCGLHCPWRRIAPGFAANRPPGEQRKQGGFAVTAAVTRPCFTAYRTAYITKRARRDRCQVRMPLGHDKIPATPGGVSPHCVLCAQKPVTNSPANRPASGTVAGSARSLTAQKFGALWCAYGVRFCKGLLDPSRARHGVCFSTPVMRA